MAEITQTAGSFPVQKKLQRLVIQVTERKNDRQPLQPVRKKFERNDGSSDKCGADRLESNDRAVIFHKEGRHSYKKIQQEEKEERKRHAQNKLQSRYSSNKTWEKQHRLNNQYREKLEKNADGSKRDGVCQFEFKYGSRFQQMNGQRSVKNLIRESSSGEIPYNRADDLHAADIPDDLGKAVPMDRFQISEGIYACENDGSYYQFHRMDQCRQKKRFAVLKHNFHI